LPYPILDKILEAYIEGNKSHEEIVAMGFAQEDVLKVGLPRCVIVNTNASKRP